MSARSSFGSTCSLNGGIARLVVRTKAENDSHGSGSGASTLPRLVTAEPCPSKPWHCQQPYLTKLALPLTASPAASAEPEARAIVPAATAASTTRTNKRVILVFLPKSARLRPDVDESRLTRLHGGNGFLDRGPEF